MATGAQDKKAKMASGLEIEPPRREEPTECWTGCAL